ncbi:hypothetical protein J1N35_008666 [Gossypium stocksii]|uniref:DUF4283 domain-containing protein n=1 Tax=Gossypium stocksii TaxID=47602 RepID=A0A9D4AGP2_9ROSI|nr:hypothetical protein J1N35_008666 [Gossypium stocksii]
MEEILAELRIEDEEESGEIELWEIEREEISTEQSSNFCLVGCFLTATVISFQSMRMVVANLWHPLGGVSITDIGEREFFFDSTLKLTEIEWLKGHHGPLTTICLLFQS